MAFETPLQIEACGRRKFRVLHPLIYITEAGVKYEVPAGRITDLASTWGIPMVSDMLDGLAPMSAVIHDMLYDGVYQGDPISRKEADAVFYEAMKAENEWYKAHGATEDAVSDLERYAFWLGVATGGGFAFRGTVDGYDTKEPTLGA